jgi:NRPS condensation-like uncharacterized protein/acyl carrier protein
LYPISFGKTVYIYTGDIKNVVQYCQYLQDNKIEMIKSTPGFLSLLAGASGKAMHIRVTITGGEKLFIHQAEEMLEYSERLIDEYGPTETTVGATYFEASGSVSRLSIGRAYANYHLYVLDAGRRVLPVGAVGELYIGGGGVARGYLNQSKLTAERFVVNPFQTEGQKMRGINGRLYKTGDLVRWLDDGELEYLGRNDEQVKIRGYRIELGEIEAKLASYPGIRQAVVVVRESGADGKYLVGYYVSGERLEEAELLEYLGDELPEWMVPSVLVWLERLPLTVNGKLDRQALPDHAVAVTVSDDGPRNETEEKLCLLFAKILGIEGQKVGVNDDFFRLGVDSISVLRLVAGIWSLFSKEVPLEIIFSKRSVAGIGSYITDSDGSAMFPPITRVKGGMRAPLSLAQEEMITYYSPNQKTSTADFILKIGGPLDVEVLTAAFVMLVRRHEALRTIVKTGKNNQLFQEVMSYKNWALEYRRKSDFRDDGEIISYIRRLIDTPFDVSSEYAIRVSLIDYLNGEFHLILVLSKMAVDGWTVSILQRELMEIYNSRLRGEKESLEKLPIRYVDFSSWQDSYLRGPVLEKQLNYWKEQLRDLTPLNLKTDHPRIPLAEARAGRTFRNIPNEVGVAIGPFCRENNFTKFAVLLTAWKLVVYKWSGQPDISVGTSISNRKRQELESIVGNFGNTIVIRSHIDEGLSFVELVDRMKEVVFAGLSHQDVRFKDIQRELKPEDDPTRTKTFQIGFYYDNYPQEKNFYLSNVRLGRDPRFMAPVAGNDIVVFAGNPMGDMYTIMADYNSSLFELATINKMLDDYVKILAWGLGDSTRIGDFLTNDPGNRDVP